MAVIWPVIFDISDFTLWFVFLSEISVDGGSSDDGDGTPVLQAASATFRHRCFLLDSTSTALSVSFLTIIASKE